jgi:tRNA (cmo5U34)-methyltransferase
VLSDLRDDARLLCVGVGTGPELIEIAERFPGWRFVAVEPSAPMLDVCRRKATERGIADRCEFHEVTSSRSHREERSTRPRRSSCPSSFSTGTRTGFFRGIADRLRPGGYPVNADLSSDASPAAYESLLDAWCRAMQAGDLTREAMERMRSAYDRDVALLPPG